MLISKNKSTRQSSQFWWANSARAVDGDNNGIYRQGWTCTRTQMQEQPWWKVKLGTDFLIDRVVVWNRVDCCADRLNNMLIEVGQYHFSRATPCGGRIAKPGRMTEVSCGLVRGDAVRVSLPGRGILTLCEVEVFGFPVPTAAPSSDPTDMPSAAPSQRPTPVPSTRASPPTLAPTPATASPVATIAYTGVWCGDSNLIAGADTKNTEKTITWDTCSSRCAANANCNYFLWGTVTYLNYPVTRCALFVKCDMRIAYKDGNPNVYVTQRTPPPTPVPSGRPSSTPTQATNRPSSAPRLATGSPTTQPPRWWFTFSPTGSVTGGRGKGWDHYGSDSEARAHGKRH